jgi:hypothetical protein
LPPSNARQGRQKLAEQNRQLKNDWQSGPEGYACGVEFDRKTKTAIALGDRLDFVSAAIQRTAVFLIRTFPGLLRCGANCNLMFTK